MTYASEPIGTGDYVQITVPGSEGARMTVSYILSGEECVSVGNPVLGVPVPAQAEITNVGVS